MRTKSFKQTQTECYEKELGQWLKRSGCTESLKGQRIFFFHRIIEKRFIVLFLLCGLNFQQTQTSIMYISLLTAFIKDQLSSKAVAALGL